MLYVNISRCKHPIKVVNYQSFVQEVVSNLITRNRAQRAIGLPALFVFKPKDFIQLYKMHPGWENFWSHGHFFSQYIGRPVLHFDRRIA